jgi:hypothetical protein
MSFLEDSIMAEPFVAIRKTHKPGDPQQVCYEVYDSDTGGSLGHFTEAAQAQKRADSMNGMTSRETGKRLDHPTDDADVE